MTLQVTQNQNIFNDKDGMPLDGGFIYVGELNKNPETSPIAIYWDIALTQPASNPVPTMNGYPSRQGAISKIYTSSPFSLTIRNKRGELIAYYADGISAPDQQIIDLSKPSGSSLIGYDDITAQDVFDSIRPIEDYPQLRTYTGRAKSVRITENLHEGIFSSDPYDFISIDDGGTIIVDAAGRRWRRRFSGPVHSAWFEGIDPTGRLYSTDAMQKAINAAVASSGVLQMYTGQYKLGNYMLSGAGGNGYKGGCLILGGPVQLPDTAVVFLQTDLAIPVLDVDAINTGLDGLMFKVWGGDIAGDGGVPITVLSTTTNTITLSADPWPGQSPILWTPETVHTSTDGTAFPTLMQFSVMGSWYASGATKNGDGTVTLTGVKGANGTPNSQIANLAGYAMESFISLPHLTAGDGENRGVVKHSIRENQMFSHLWFTQVENAFVYTEFGSGGGPGVGVGNTGFMDNVVLDLGKSLIWAPKDINGLQATNVQAFGVTRYTFHAPYGVVRSVNLATFKQYVGRVVRAQGLSAFTFNGNEVNGYDGTGYSDYAFNIGSEGIEGSTIVGCAMGRARYPVIQVSGDIKNSAIGANSFRSNGDGGTNQAAIVANDIIGSNLMGNAFGRLHSSWQYSIQLTSPTATLSGTSLDPDLFDRVASTPVLNGWRAAAFNSGWSASDVAVQFSRSANVVRLRGTFKGSGGSSVLTLPLGYRPSSNIRVVLPFDSASGRTLCTIAPDGNLYVSDAISNWCDLSSISFIS